MPAFTIVKDGLLGAVLILTGEDVPTNLQTGETYIEGAYPPDLFKLVNGVVTELDNAELADLGQQRRAAKLQPARGIKSMVHGLKVAGYHTEKSLPATDWTQADALLAIALAAGRVRTRSVTPGNLLVMEYERLIIEVRPWIAIGRDANNVPRMLNSYATNYGHTASEAADIIVAASDAYDDLLFNTYDIRHAGAAAVLAASEDFASVAQPFINQLDAL
jgi:hypothetical protein